MSAASSTSAMGGVRGSDPRNFVHEGIDRLWDRGWPVLQTAVAVGLAWYLASVIFGHEKPVFASIAALISLGVAVGRQWKRAFQVILGVGSGIALASFLVLVVGVGPLQMVLVVGLPLAAAVFLGARPVEMFLDKTSTESLLPAASKGIVGSPTYQWMNSFTTASKSRLRSSKAPCPTPSMSRRVAPVVPTAGQLSSITRDVGPHG